MSGTTWAQELQSFQQENQWDSGSTLTEGAHENDSDASRRGVWELATWYQAEFLNEKPEGDP